MDVERKHNLDKRTQHSSVNSVAKASRDATLRSWRGHTNKPAAPAARITTAIRKRKRGLKHLTVASMALSERPDVSPAISKDGGHALRDYIRSNREDLLAKVQIAQAQDMSDMETMCKAGRSSRFALSWPLSRASWIVWIEENEGRFQDVLRDMQSGARRCINEQLSAEDGVPDYAPLQAPKTKKPRLAWARLIRNGWYALQLLPEAFAAAAVPRQEVVLLAVSAGGQQAAYKPCTVQGCGFEVPCGIDLDKVLKPFWEVMPAVFLTGKVSVFRLRMKAVLQGNSYWLQPVQATPVEIPACRRKRKTKRPAKKAAEETSTSSGSDVDTNSEHGKDSVLPDSDSDGKLSFASTADNSLEEACDEAPAAPVAPPPAPAAPVAPPRQRECL